VGREQFSIEEAENAKNTFHSTVTNLLKKFKERKEKDPSGKDSFLGSFFG